MDVFGKNPDCHLHGRGTAWDDEPPIQEEVVKALEVARGLFPSAAGLKDHAPQHVIAFYVNLGELRAVKSLIDDALALIKGSDR